MKKVICSMLMTVMVCSILCSIPAYAAGEKFDFKFTDLYNHSYPTTWTKGNSNGYYLITLKRLKGLTPNTMSSTNIFGCKMKDLSIVPVVDKYHTFSNYVSNFQINYQKKTYRGDTMQLGAKKDDASTSGKALKISGTIQP